MHLPPSLASTGRLRDRVARGLRKRWSVLTVLGLLSLPLIAACIWLYRESPAPIFDLALFEMRVRDVGTRNTPLVGLGGRLSRWPEMGSHPGPLAFYVLAPLYWLLGASYLALRAATALLAIAANAVALTLSQRRWGHAGVLVTGVVLGLVDLAFGLHLRTDPWNPYLPVPWVTPFLLAVVLVLSGDVKLLPLVAAIGTFCGQTHISYLALCGGLGFLAFGAAVALWLRTPARRREIVWACGLSVVTAVVLWVPPFIEELRRDRGNLTIITEYLRNPGEMMLGLGKGLELTLSRFDLWFLVKRAFETPGVLALPMGGDPAPVRGMLVLSLWLALLGRALWKREVSKLPLHAVVGVSLGLCALSTSRIIGFPFVYVVFFVWLVCGFLLLSLLMPLADSRAVRLHPRIAAGVALGLVTLSALRSSLAVEEAGGRDFGSAKQLAALVPSTVAHLRPHAARHPQTRYLVTWEDALHGGGQGLGLAVELERRGFHVAVPDSYAPAVGRHRVMDPTKAVARVYMVNAGWIAAAERIPGALRVAYADLRSPALLRDYEKARAELITGLHRIGRADMIPRVDLSVPDSNVAGLGFERLSVARMTEIGVPAAVFLIPGR